LLRRSFLTAGAVPFVARSTVRGANDRIHVGFTQQSDAALQARRYKRVFLMGTQQRSIPPRSEPTTSLAAWPCVSRHERTPFRSRHGAPEPTAEGLNIARELGRTLHDKEASRLLSRPRRRGYELPKV
jgi:hypothetical protein